MKRLVRLSQTFKSWALFWVFLSATAFSSVLANEEQPKVSGEEQLQEEDKKSGGGWLGAFNLLNGFQEKAKDFFFHKTEVLEGTTFMDLPKYKRPSQRVIEMLGSGDYLGRHRLTGEPCLISQDEDALDTFSNFAPCWMNNLYEERLDKNIVEDYGEEVSRLHHGHPPQAYSLNLRKEGVDEFCQCTMAKDGIRSMNRGSEKGEAEKKQEFINHAAHDGMSRIAKKFREIQKKVAYAMTSREMAGYTLKEGEKGASELAARSTLTHCMPSDMAKLLRDGKFEGQNAGQRFCGEKGVRRLAQGMKQGEKFDCQEVDVPERQDPECGPSSMDTIELDENADLIAEITRGFQVATARGSQGQAQITQLNTVLKRHRQMDRIPYRARRRGQPGPGPEFIVKRGEDLGFTEVGDANFSRESVKNGDYTNSLMEMVKKSRANEFSRAGEALFNRNTASIRRAFESALSSGRVSQKALDEVDTDHLSSYLETNPYLQERLAASLGIEDFGKLQEGEILKKAVKAYVEKDLYRAHKTLGANENYDLSFLMGVTYGPSYYDTINQCEDIQKTMISLCRALDYDEGEESIGAFFTDARLVDLYAEDLQKMQKGEASPGVYKGFGAASSLFCEEAQSEGGVEKLNRAQSELQRELAINSTFAQMENERMILHEMASTDQKIRKNALQRLQVKQRTASQSPNVIKFDNREETMKASLKDSYAVLKDGLSKSNVVTQQTSQDSGGKKMLKLDPRTKTSVEADEGAAKKEGQKLADKNLDSGVSEQTQGSQGEQFNRFQESFNSAQALQTNLGGANNSALSDEERRANGEAQEQVLGREDLQNMDPVERDLMGQIEKMQAREAQMMEQIKKLSQQMEEDREKDALKEKEKEVTQLQKQMQDLKKELAEVRNNRDETNKRAPAAAKIERRPRDKGLFGGTRRESSRVDSNASASRPMTPPSSAAGLPSAPDAATSSDSTRSSRDSGGSGANTGLSPGNFAPNLTGTQSQSVAKIRIPRGASIAPPDMSLTSLALNAQGNVALRETRSPGVLERVVFKMENGEIVYENGHPVIDKRETVSVEEDEEQTVAESEPEESQGQSREPASLEEELLELERKVRPRASHRELIETLQQNTEN